MTPDTDDDELDDDVLETEDRLQQAIAEDDDMTGQDNEERINQAAADLVAARDRSLRRRDPETYNEMRQMGLLG